MKCPVCESSNSIPLDTIDGYEYLRCESCGSLHIAHGVIEDIDRGRSPRRYNESYWREELRAARERAQGSSLVRAGEAILYCRRPVVKFLDVGAGPGYLLDEISKLFPDDKEIFHGVELFPPDEHSTSPNYHIGDVSDLEGESYDAGVCVEVVEHLTPRMLSGLVKGLAKVSRENSLWLFNTGMPDYVLNEDRGYLDPVNRGHIVSYSIPALKKIFEPYGFRIAQLPGKSFAFLAEYKSENGDTDLEERIFRPLEINLDLLKKHLLLYQATLESARGYFYYQGYMERTLWALSLQEEINQRVGSRQNE